RCGNSWVQSVCLPLPTTSHLIAAAAPAGYRIIRRLRLCGRSPGFGMIFNAIVLFIYYFTVFN
ncbi:MAG TPA: hypothetical protein VGC22_13315, partial [Chitinophaga sp.]